MAVACERRADSSVNVSDFAAAVKWYEEVLGFQKLYDIPDMGWGEWTTNVPGMTIGISEVQPGSNAAPGPGGENGNCT